MDPLGPLSTSSPEDPLVQLAQQYWPPVSHDDTSEAAHEEPKTPSKKKGASKGKKKSPAKSEQPPKEHTDTDIDNDIVDAIYYGHLKAHENRIDRDRLTVLEFTGFLERYLWPRFDANRASFAQVMLILLVCEDTKDNGLDTVCVINIKPT